MLELMRRSLMLAAEYSFCFTIKYVYAHRNGIADAMSRMQTARFYQLAPEANDLLKVLPDLAPLLLPSLSKC